MLTMLVANNGGHLTQLMLLVEALPALGEVFWVTADTPQSRRLLAGQDVEHLERHRSRDAAAVARNAARARRIVRDRRPDRLVTTGSSFALAAMGPAVLAGARCHYLESVTRVAGPSVSGRLISHLPGVALYTQHQSWAGGRWRYAGSLLDRFRGVPGEGEPRPPRTVLVTLGSTVAFRFDRLVDRLRAILPAECDVTWQLPADYGDLPGRSCRDVPEDEFRELVRGADAVVSHAGAGTALTCLELGASPVLVPRRADLREHVDGHQEELARVLGGRGLARVVDASAITMADLAAAGHTRIVTSPAQPLAIPLD